jgi:hypothetical protein
MAHMDTLLHAYFMYFMKATHKGYHLNVGCTADYNRNTETLNCI